MTESLSYKNQSIGLLCKSMERFLYDRDFRHEIVKDVFLSLLLGPYYQCNNESRITNFQRRNPWNIKMESFLTLVINYWKLFTNSTKSSVLDVTGVLILILGKLFGIS